MKFDVPYGITKRIPNVTMADARARATTALQAEGFGVLTEIDVQQTFAQKLQLSFRRYHILGACNPTLAHRALSAEIDAGVMLPCNVIVYEGDDGRTVVNIVDPLQSQARESGPLRQIAEEARMKLDHVLGHLA